MWSANSDQQVLANGGNITYINTRKKVHNGTENGRDWVGKSFFVEKYTTHIHPIEHISNCIFSIVYNSFFSLAS